MLFKKSILDSAAIANKASAPVPVPVPVSASPPKPTPKPIFTPASPGNESISPQKMSASLRPIIIYRERAPYTEEARANKIQGEVVLALTYNADGRISDIQVVKGLPFGLTENAVTAAKKIRFQPALERGIPVSVRGELIFNFILY